MYVEGFTEKGKHVEAETEGFAGQQGVPFKRRRAGEREVVHGEREGRKMPEKGQPCFGEIQFAVDVPVNPQFDLFRRCAGEKDGPEEHQQEEAADGEAGVFDNIPKDFFHAGGKWIRPVDTIQADERQK